MKKLIFILAILASITTYADTSREIYNRCTSKDYSFDQGYCYGYLHGAETDAELLTNKKLNNLSYSQWYEKYDLQHLNYGQIKKYYIQFLRKHPDYMGMYPAETLAAMYISKFKDIKS